MPIQGLAMSWIPVCLSGSAKVPGLVLAPVSTDRFAEQAILWILAVAPQGPATGFLKFCFLELFISSVLPSEKRHCCHTSLGTQPGGDTTALGSGFKGLPSSAAWQGWGGCIPPLPRSAGGLAYPACLLPWMTGQRLAEGCFPGISLPSVPVPPAATSRS